MPFPFSIANRRTGFLATLGLAVALLPAPAMAQTSCSHRAGHRPRRPTPLLAPWGGPHGGVPAFDQVKVADFKPALEAAMAENLAEIKRHCQQPGRAHLREHHCGDGAQRPDASTGYRPCTASGTATLNDTAFGAVERRWPPSWPPSTTRLPQNPALFKRIEAVYNSPATKKLTPEQQRLAEVVYKQFVRAGARLDAPAKARLSAINQQLAGLFTKFSQNVLADEADSVLVLKTEQDLGGLPASLRDAAKTTAGTRKIAAAGVITNTRSSIDPFLTYSDQRKLREKAWRMFTNRGDNGGAHDNNALITQILQLRAERAKLLGYPTHAHLRLDNTMAKTPEAAMQLMEQVWKPAVARVHEEVADMLALAKKEGAPANFKFEPWDYRYYAEKVRKARYDLDQNEVKQYLQLDKMREGMFWVAGELFNFTFVPVTDVPVYHPDVKVWQVNDKTTGKQVGLWYFDPYARARQKLGRLDECLPQPGAHGRQGRDHHRVEQLQLREGQARRARAHFLDRRHHAVPRVRPRPARAVEQRDLPHRCRAPAWCATTWSSPRSCSKTGCPRPRCSTRFALHYQTGQPIPQALVTASTRPARSTRASRPPSFWPAPSST